MEDGLFSRTWRDVGSADSMFEHARLKDFAPGDGGLVGAFQERFDEEGWIPISVPGEVHRALLDAGRIEGSFYDRNEEKCAWLEAREWWYRMTFEGPQEPLRPGERLRLVFQGLDTFATIWLNGEELGGHSNMLLEISHVQGRTSSPFASSARSTTSERSTLTSGDETRRASPCARRSSASGGIEDRGYRPSGSGAPSNCAAHFASPSEASTSMPWT